jgi:hypothetical protein
MRNTGLWIILTMITLVMVAAYMAKWRVTPMTLIVEEEEEGFDSQGAGWDKGDQQTVFDDIAKTILGDKWQGRSILGGNGLPTLAPLDNQGNPLRTDNSDNNLWANSLPVNNSDATARIVPALGPEMRATAQDLRLLLSNIQSEVIRLQFTGTADEVVRARLGNLQDTANRVRDVLTSVENGSLNAKDIPWDIDTLHKMFPTPQGDDDVLLGAWNKDGMLMGPANIGSADEDVTTVQREWSEDPKERQQQKEDIPYHPNRFESDKAIAVPPASFDYKDRFKKICEMAKNEMPGETGELGCTNLPDDKDFSDMQWKGRYLMLCNRLGWTWDGAAMQEKYGCPVATRP